MNSESQPRWNGAVAAFRSNTCSRDVGKRRSKLGPDAWQLSRTHDLLMKSAPSARWKRRTLQASQAGLWAATKVVKISRFRLGVSEVSFRPDADGGLGLSKVARGKLKYRYPRGLCIWIHWKPANGLLMTFKATKPKVMEANQVSKVPNESLRMPLEIP